MQSTYIWELAVNKLPINLHFRVLSTSSDVLWFDFCPYKGLSFLKGT